MSQRFNSTDVRIFRMGNIEWLSLFRCYYFVPWSQLNMSMWGGFKTNGDYGI
jgi:hypothetical protein